MVTNLAFNPYFLQVDFAKSTFSTNPKTICAFFPPIFSFVTYFFAYVTRIRYATDQTRNIRPTLQAQDGCKKTRVSIN